MLIQYNGRNYYIDIKEAKPQDAVSIIETDCEVDFEAPKDYVEPEPSPKPVASVSPPCSARACAPVQAGR